MHSRLEPKLITVLREGYTKKQFTADLVAGHHRRNRCHAIARSGRREKAPKVLIIRMRMIPAIDATGLQALDDVLDRTRREGGTLMLKGVAKKPLRAMEQSGFLERIGRENVLENIDATLQQARELLN